MQKIASNEKIQCVDEERDQYDLYLPINCCENIFFQKFYDVWKDHKGEGKLTWHCISFLKSL